MLIARAAAYTPALSCCVIYLLCVLIARPFANIGFIDDWSYSDVALRFAQTGHIHYNGWGSPMLLFQAVWGAAWIRIFGFSFDILRAATLPFSTGFVLLVYALGRRVGLTRTFASFGAIAAATSPLFLPLSASFMTDVYGCFFSTLCIYAAIAFLEAQSTRAAQVWLIVLTVAGIVGGSDRQTVWAAPLTVIPYIAFARRRNPRLLRASLIALCVCVASLVFLITHFHTPYAVYEFSAAGALNLMLENGPYALRGLAALSLTTALMVSPALFCFARFWGRLGGAQVLLVFLGCFLFVISCVLVVGQLGAVPFAVGLLSHFGVLSVGVELLGRRPPALSIPIRIGLSVLVEFGALAYWLLNRGLVQRTSQGLKVETRNTFLLFSVAYTLLLIPGSFAGITYDRYALPVMPLLIVCVLCRFQSRADKVPIAAWVCLVAFAAYAVAITHDYFETSRARVEAAHFLELRDIPRSLISAGLEYDGWTQLQFANQIPGVRYGDRVVWNTSNKYWFWNYTNALTPKYVVSYISELHSPGTSKVVGYEAWLPPHQRFVGVYRIEDLPRRKLCYGFLEPCSDEAP
jgi:hypothetical protein